MPRKLPPTEFLMSKIAEQPREIKKGEHFYESGRSLTCPTCGKVFLFQLHFNKNYVINYITKKNNFGRILNRKNCSSFRKLYKYFDSDYEFSSV